MPLSTQRGSDLRPFKKLLRFRVNNVNFVNTMNNDSVWGIQSDGHDIAVQNTTDTNSTTMADDAQFSDAIVEDLSTSVVDSSMASVGNIVDDGDRVSEKSIESRDGYKSAAEIGVVESVAKVNVNEINIIVEKGDESLSSATGDPTAPVGAIVPGEDSSGDEVRLKYKKCVVCEKECRVRIKRCKDCSGGRYCSRACRDAHKPQHRDLCGYIAELEKMERAKLLCDSFSVREVDQVPLLLRNKLVKLVGEKPLLNCRLDGKRCDGLWDTGAMVSMVNAAWLRGTLPEARILSIKEFLEGDNLNLLAANNTNVDVLGVVELKLRVGSYEVPVPFLVTEGDLCNPIIGYNVIKHVVLSGVKDLPEALRDTIPSVGANANAVIALLQSDTFCEEDVKVARDTSLPPRSRCRVDCRTHYVAAGSCENLVFSPYPLDMELEMSESVVKLKRGKRSVQVVVSNPTNTPMVLNKGLVLGSVESVSAIVPLGSGVDHNSEAVEVNNVNICEVETPVADIAVDLSHLPEDQRAVAQKFLNEERDVFCTGKEDHGDCPDLVLELNLTDNVPVVVPHRQIPRPLYEEVKNFLNDLIANNWVRESNSCYSSPIVCVRKKRW